MSVTSSQHVALVTGASRGIGKAILLRLAQQKHLFVVGTATTQQGADQITQYLKEADLQGQGIVLDIVSAHSVETGLHHCIAVSGGMPSILVNNAGITSDNLFIRMNLETWSTVLDVNLTGTYRLIQSCIRPMMKQRFGRIVNLSSVVGVTGNAGQANYAASKSGLLGLTKSLAREFGSRGITINAVAPGFIETDMTRVLVQEQHQKLLDQIPVGRMGKPEEVAEAVAFLVSEQAGYITGETLHVNGGMYMS